jgi:NAD+ synthase (glutamine-hydrolysing)
VATEIGAQFVSIDVDNLVKGYTKLAEQALGRPLDWDHDDLALQNIQARVRSPSIWMIANVKNALLLATSNRSEAAVGYTTMDGDTSGSISPVAGIDKDFLRRWLEWAGKPSARAARLLNPPRPFPYVAALTLVTRQAPTAELRPAAAAQTDEKDLMPYDVLDAIEKAAIRDKQSPVEVYKIVRAAFPRPHWSSSLVAEWVTKFFRLWARNQWKRERLALSFHIDDEDLDPRAWCRFPVLSGGFQKELEELERHAAQDKDAI